MAIDQIVEKKEERKKKLMVMEIVLSEHNLIYPGDLSYKEQVYYVRLGIFNYGSDVKNYAGKYKGA